MSPLPRSRSAASQRAASAREITVVVSRQAFSSGTEYLSLTTTFSSRL
jgi:hypothetical protein